MTYQPREDTYLLKSVLEELDLEGKKVLEIGTGSGEIAAEAARRGAKVTATDIDPEALKDAREKFESDSLEIEIVESDLFEKVEGNYDYILFNPPYLPGKRRDEADPLIGGKTGNEIIQRFLDQFYNYISQDGRAYLLISSLSSNQILKEEKISIVKEKELWVEKLYLVSISN